MSDQPLFDKKLRLILNDGSFNEVHQVCMNPAVRTNKYNPSIPTIGSHHFNQSPRTASYFLFTLLLFLLNLSPGQSDAEAKCPIEMGWDGINDTTSCKTWLPVQYDASNENDILDQAIATCNDLPNGEVWRPRKEYIQEKDNGTDKFEGSIIHPWRLLEKIEGEGSSITVVTMDTTSRSMESTTLSEEQAVDYRNVNSKDLPACLFMSKGGTNHVGSCNTHDGAVRVLCKSSKVELCNPEGRKCRCDDGWEAPFCAKKQNKCKANSCSNGGVCFTNDEGEASCACLPGSTGTKCEKDSENDCDKVTCSYHGKCEDKLRDFKCTCDAGFTGNFCEIAIRSSATVVSITTALPLVTLILQAIASWHPLLLTSY
ncbi:EGF-like domain protein [Trichuris suis]|nr:EGF-like domain protein [Trichuris suis]